MGKVVGGSTDPADGKSLPEQGSNLSVSDPGSPARRNWVLDLLLPLLNHCLVFFLVKGLL